MFLKLLVLLVPRELEVSHSGGVKAMTDEQIEAAIEANLGPVGGARGCEGAKVIDAVPEPVALRLHRVSQGASATLSTPTPSHHTLFSPRLSAQTQPAAGALMEDAGEDCGGGAHRRRLRRDSPGDQRRRPLAPLLRLGALFRPLRAPVRD